MCNDKIQELKQAMIPGEDTGITVKRTICGFCGEQCIVDAYMKDGKIIKVEGSNDLGAANQGTLCVKGAALKQSLYHPDRLLYPMKRVGKRGEGRFERITWEEAMDTIAAKMQETKEKHGAKHTMVYAGHPKWFRHQLGELCNAYGTPNYGSESSACAYAVMLAQECIFGKTGRFTRPDMPKVKTLLIWGVNQMYSRANTGSKGYLSMVERGVNVIVVDSRHTPTTDHATLHLQPIPGTDGALALSMAHVILKEGLENREYIEKYTEGFEAFAEYAMQFTPERAEEITGVPAELIVKAARMLAANGPIGLQMSASPMVHHINGVQNVRAISALILLTGSFGVEGGTGGPGPGRAGFKNGFLSNPLHRVDADQDLSHKEFPAWAVGNFYEAQVTRMADYLSGKGEYPIHTLIAFGMNHHMWPQPSNIEAAFENLDFFVNVDMYKTETCDYADIILPAATALEREQLLMMGRGMVVDLQPIIEPMGEVRNDMDIILDLAGRLGLEVGDPVLKSYEDFLHMSLSTTGLSLEELRAAPDGLPNAAKPVMRTSEMILSNIKTPSGKMEFASRLLADCDMPYHDALPIYRDFREVLPMDEYPLILCTGCRKPQLFHKRTYRLPWINNLEETPVIELHPETAKELGIADGETVVLRTPIGAMEMTLVYDTSGLPGVVHVYHGAKDKDINEILDQNYYDPISGFPGYKSYCCRLEKKEG
ncbi:MAG: molybdopterin-dependent oxidoreductase [Clostridia bacterium]|nr:molybdopterin-dependent oxidoreductase [Clostridia bacterium]